MIQEIRVVDLVGDIRSTRLLNEIRSTLHIEDVSEVRIVKVYRFEGLPEDRIAQLAETLLCESISQRYVVGSRSVFADQAQYVVEVGYKPGVMNPEVASILKAVKDLGIHDVIAADTSYEYYFYGACDACLVQQIVNRLLVNNIVQWVIAVPPKTLLIEGVRGCAKFIAIRDLSDEQLIALSCSHQFFLNLEEMKVIQKYFQEVGREPFDVELESLAQTWSEHCGHKTFKARLVVDGQEKEPFMTRLKKGSLPLHKSRGVISAFHDNAGVFSFFDGFGVSAKVETHNSPSAIEPYGGAATGSGGVFRDIMGTGLGMKNILSTDMFCVGSLEMRDEEVLPGCLYPEYVLSRVVAGVRDFGNRMGIPTANGSVHVHHDFRAKPTVIVGAYGIAPEQFCHKGQARVGDKVFVVGGRTGRDGIHGATFSSGAMTAETVTVNAQAVQIGNAIEEKRMTDALLECRDQGLIQAITDCGAGGLSSAVGEMGERLGVLVDLLCVPLKYSGLMPWEIWVSESQERMVVAVSPECAEQFIDVCAQYNVEATKIGVFTDDRLLRLVYEGEIVCSLEMTFLHGGLPQRVMHAKSPKVVVVSSRMSDIVDWQEVYSAVLGHGSVCSKEPIVRQYDHGVQGTNVLAPFGGVRQDGPNDAVVLTPILGKEYGLVVSHGMHPVLMRRDAYQGALWSVAEAMANLVAVGGDPEQVVLVNNYIWPFPDEHSLGVLDRAVDGVVEAMQRYGAPVISGKDSLSSTYTFADGTRLEIPPVLCISAVGRMHDVRKSVSSDFKHAGSVIILVGQIARDAIGGSVYEELFGRDEVCGDVPNVDAQRMLWSLWKSVHSHIVQGDILSCHDISEGGVAVTLAEMCFGGRIGASFDVGLIGEGRLSELFFTEMAGCFLVEVSVSTFCQKKLFVGVPHVALGQTHLRQTITLFDHGKYITTLSLEVLRQAWQKPMQEVFGS